ncbi:DUF6236 family protein [Amycolatopsis carbonis]|uniref:DUF6236 family protein n=1 Tax=Amycolatopsis carbonis TaxID=715471 RepID=A0A9Y2MXF2_9PSEU|nr:DUF6236 family protein [Amycolatopsis sp. 2-15]WIX82241.1 DUF6236 family protein [Amycolatopsis sp. 2-15]
MDPIALYYPYIHVRDDRWLKYAALYWPKLARLRPAGYPTLDSPVSRALRSEANWLVDVTPPAWAAQEVGRPFLELLESHEQSLRDRFALDRIHRRVGYRGSRRSVRRTSLSAGSYGRDLPDWLDYVHVGKMSPEWLGAAMVADLASTYEGRGETWVGMHPELAAVYTCALVERIATENRLHPVTDQELPHTAASGWTLDRLADVLLGTAPTSAARPDAEDGFVFSAFETVVPAGLDTVPVEKIIEVRTKFGAELDAFRRYVTEQSEKLAQLQDVRDVEVFREYLRDEVDRAVTDQLKQLRDRLRSVGLESVRGVVNVKSVAPPALVTIAADTVGLSPAIAGSATMAACVVAAPAQWRRQRRAAIRESPVGYLFQLDRELNPTGLIDRLRRAWPG